MKSKEQIEKKLDEAHKEYEEYDTMTSVGKIEALEWVLEVICPKCKKAELREFE